MAVLRKARRHIGDGPGRRNAGRALGVASIAATLVLGLAATGLARGVDLSDSPQGRYDSTTSTSRVRSSSTSSMASTSTSRASTSTTSTSTTSTSTTSTTTSTTTTTTIPQGGAGCTPGYWKQVHHYDSWAGYSPGDDYETVFGVDASFSANLGEALALRGGGEFALARHATAALLNSANPGVSYEFTTAGVIAVVQDAYATGEFEAAKDLLASANEEGCPLN